MKIDVVLTHEFEINGEKCEKCVQFTAINCSDEFFTDVGSFLKDKMFKVEIKKSKES